MNTGATFLAAAVLVLAGCSPPAPARPKENPPAATKPEAGVADAFARADQIIAELKQREQPQPAPRRAAPPGAETSGNTTTSRLFGRPTVAGAAGVPADFDPSRADERTWKATVRAVETGLAEAQKEAGYAATRVKYATSNLRRNASTANQAQSDSLERAYAEAVANQEYWAAVMAAYEAAVVRLRDVAARNNIPDSWLRWP